MNGSVGRAGASLRPGRGRARAFLIGLAATVVLPAAAGGARDLAARAPPQLPISPQIPAGHLAVHLVGSGDRDHGGLRRQDAAACDRPTLRHLLDPGGLFRLRLFHRQRDHHSDGPGTARDHRRTRGPVRQARGHRRQEHGGRLPGRSGAAGRGILRNEQDPIDDVQKKVLRPHGQVLRGLDEGFDLFAGLDHIEGFNGFGHDRTKPIRC